MPAIAVEDFVGYIMMDSTSSKGLFLVRQKLECSENLTWLRGRGWT